MKELSTIHEVDVIQCQNNNTANNLLDRENTATCLTPSSSDGSLSTAVSPDKPAHCSLYREFQAIIAAESGNTESTLSKRT